MGNEENSTGSTLKNTAKGAVVGAAYGAVLGPEGAVVGGVVGGLVGAASSIFSGGPHAEHVQANVGGGSIDAYTIYEKISKGNTSSLDGGRSAADTLQKLHSGRSQQIDALNNKMNGAWQGNSAGAAQSGANALKIWHDDSAKNLGTSQTFMTNQVDAFHDVHGKVQELPKDPPEMKWYDHQPFSDKDDEIDKYNQNSQTNVQAYTAYYGSSSQNASGMPQYNVWQGNNISDGNTDPGKYGGGPGTGPGGSGGFSGGPGGVGGGGFTPPKTNPPKFTPPGGGGGNYKPPKVDPPKFTLRAVPAVPAGQVDSPRPTMARRPRAGRRRRLTRRSSTRAASARPVAAAGTAVEAAAAAAPVLVPPSDPAHSAVRASDPAAAVPVRRQAVPAPALVAQVAWAACVVPAQRARPVRQAWEVWAAEPRAARARRTRSTRPSTCWKKTATKSSAPTR